MNDSERVLRGALEAAIRCIRGEIPSDGYIGDQQLLPTLERVLAMPDTGEPTLMDKAMQAQIDAVDRLEKSRAAEKEQQPKLRDLYILAALQSPVAAMVWGGGIVDEEAIAKWCEFMADTLLRRRAA